MWEEDGAYSASCKLGSYLSTDEPEEFPLQGSIVLGPRLPFVQEQWKVVLWQRLTKCLMKATVDSDRISSHLPFFSQCLSSKVQKHFWHNLLHWQINGFDVRVGNFHLAEWNLAIVVVSRDQEPCLSLFLCLVSQTDTSVFREVTFFCTGQGLKAEPELVHKLLVYFAPCPRAGLASLRSDWSLLTGKQGSFWDTIISFGR